MREGYQPNYGKYAGLLLIGMFLLVVWFGMLPYLTRVIEKVQLKNTLSEQVAFSSNWEEQLVKLRDYRNQLEVGIQSLEQSQLTPDEAFRIVEAMYTNAENTFVEVVRISQEPILGVDQPRQQLTIELEGRYHAIASFVNQMESGFPLIISDIQMQRSSEANLLSVNLTLIVQYKGES